MTPCAPTRFRVGDPDESAASANSATRAVEAGSIERRIRDVNAGRSAGEAKEMEAEVGIEPAYTALQAAA